MSEIHKEYPEGQHQAEIVLVEMLREKRSWCDYVAITDALWRIRFNAKRMQKEHEILFGNSAGKCKEAPAN